MDKGRYFYRNYSSYSCNAQGKRTLFIDRFFSNDFMKRNWSFFKL